MKKLVDLFCIMILCCCCIFASTGQKTYVADDEVVVRVERLMRLTGKIGFSPVFPITENRLRENLDSLDYEKLSPALRAEYDAIRALLGIPGSFADFTHQDNFNLSVSSNIEGYGFNHGKDTPYIEYYIPYRDRKPLLAIDIEGFFNDILYLNMDYSFRGSPKGFMIDESGNTRKGNYFYDITNSGFILSPSINGGFEYFNKSDNPAVKDCHDLLTYQPVMLGASLGNDILGFYIGRTRQSMGSGVTGNLIIGDNFSYQEVMRVNAHGKFFDYHLSLTHYDNVEEAKDFRFDGIHQNRTIQRFDFNILDNLRFSVDLGCHIASSSMFDWRMFTPMSFVHNWNNNDEIVPVEEGDEINNILGIELEYVPVNGLKLTAQFALDQFMLSHEVLSKLPNAYGMLFNAKYATEISHGILDSWFECVYLNPYLYLNHKDYKDTGKPYMYLDHMGGYWYDQSGVGEYDYFGHGYGPGTVAVSVGTDYDCDYGFNIEGRLEYKAQGYRGRLYNLDATKARDEYWGWSNTMEIPEENVIDEWGVLQHILSLQVSFDYSVLSNLDIYAGINMSYYWNYHNVPHSERFTLQSMIGLSCKIF